MTATTMDGEALATRIRDELRDRVTAVTLATGTPPGLGTLLVGDDGPSHRYVSMKHADCEALGIASFDERLPADAHASDVEAVIDRWNADPAVDAVLPQYPFPAHLDYEALFRRIDPEKDADGLHPVNLGRLVMGVDAPLACTPAGILALLHAHQVPVAGHHVVIVGRGLTIGRPLANLLALKRPDANAAVTVVHTGRRRPRRLHPPGRRPGGRGRLARHDHRRHGEARCRGGGCRGQLRGQEGDQRRGRRGGRGGRAGCRPASAASAP